MSEEGQSESVEERVRRLAAMNAPFGEDQPSGFERMTEDRFHALGLWGLPQRFRNDVVPVSFWSADNERLLATVYQDPEDFKVGIGLLARDPQRRYRMFAHYEPLPTVRAAEAAIRGNWGRSALAGNLHEI